MDAQETQGGPKKKIKLSKANEARNKKTIQRKNNKRATTQGEAIAKKNRKRKNEILAKEMKEGPPKKKQKMDELTKEMTLELQGMNVRTPKKEKDKKRTKTKKKKSNNK